MGGSDIPMGFPFAGRETPGLSESGVLSGPATAGSDQRGVRRTSLGFCPARFEIGRWYVVFGCVNGGKDAT